MLTVGSPWPVPARVLFVCLGTLALLALGTLAFPEVVSRHGAVLWPAALLPVLVSAYYGSWPATIIAAGVGALVLELSLALAAATTGDDTAWPFHLGVLAAYLGTASGIAWLAGMLHRERSRAQQLALTDALTELPNRRYATLFLQSEFAAAQRGRHLAVVLFDLDRFKAYNDRYGHAAGDQALRSLAQVLATITRHMNLSARFGGEEFLSILSDCDVQGAVSFAERIRAQLRAAPLPGAGLTVSAGVAMYDPALTTLDELLAAADAALYEAKRSGRDCVRVAASAMLP